MDFRDLFFPRQCLVCKADGRYLCVRCLSKVSKAREICAYCNYYSYHGKVHVSCQKANEIDGHIAVWKYEGIVRKGIHAFKYRFASDIAAEFVSNIDKKNLTQFNHPLLIPVPLHKKRENWRGFNQSALLAKGIARKIGWEYAENVLERTENTSPQAQLGREERMQNLSGKFAVNTSIFSKYDPSKAIMIVDDVWTTGSTIKEAAKVLKKAGAKEVWGLTLAS